MKPQSPWKLIGIGFVLVVLGFVLPLLMVIDVIPTSLLLSLVSHGASVSGLILGIAGTIMARQISNDRNQNPDQF
jgi:hypothetical protein